MSHNAELKDLERLAIQLATVKNPKLEAEIDGEKFIRTGQRARDVACGMLLVIRSLEISATAEGGDAG